MKAVSYTHLDVYKRQTLYYLVPSSGPTVMPELGNTQEIDASNYHAVAFCSVYGGDDTILTWGRNYDCLLYTSRCV